jgi:hypothetical protein
VYRGSRKHVLDWVARDRFPVELLAIGGHQRTAGGIMSALPRLLPRPGQAIPQASPSGGGRGDAQGFR